MKCERCGDSFACESQNKDKRCWCIDVPVVSRIPQQYKDCLCPKCLQALAQRTDIELIEGEDFYYESGLMVFTEKYHLKKGSCCNNGCRHCPY